jgi:hypothetical protein
MRNNVFRNSAGTDVVMNPAYSQWDAILSSIPGGGLSSDQFLIRRSPSGLSNPSFTTFMVLNASGFVGIGNSTPDGPLCIARSITGSNNIITMQNTNAADSVGFRIRNVPYTNSTQSYIDFVGNSASNFASYLAFGTNSGAGASEAMRITATGSILFSSAPYTTNGTVVTVGGIGALNISSDARVKNSIRYFDSTGYIYSRSSSPTAYISFTGYNSLQRVMSLRPAQFKRNGYTDEYEGFIAQQVEQHLPLAVDGKKYDYEVKRDLEGNILKDENGQPILNYDIPRYRGLSDAAILAHTVKALQELTEYQTKQIDRLTDRVTSLETYLEAALLRITALENA